ncbi:hypothetical protein [Micromonospora sp. NPDC023737]|uniref:hypothetical protein n=1 Tax=unclassified Micromonospora TaxID=2617518 RepID=UPI0033E62D29
MGAKRGDRAAPPPHPGGYSPRVATNDAAKGWEELCRQAAVNTRTCWIKHAGTGHPKATDQHPPRPHAVGRHPPPDARPPYAVVGPAHRALLVRAEVLPCRPHRR